MSRKELFSIVELEDKSRQSSSSFPEKQEPLARRKGEQEGMVGSGEGGP